MTNAYSALLGRCGLSHREAAEFHRVRLDTVKSWSSGRNRAPDGAMAELRDLYVKIEKSAAELLNMLPKAADDVELGVARDDHEAQLIGWPCVSAQVAALGLVVARCAKARIVPRGSTAATAAAVTARA